MADPISCPFCGYTNGNEYAIQLHIEEQHTEDSPFVAQEASIPAAATSNNASSKRRCDSVDASMPGDMWTRCTRANCGEYVLLSEIDEHLELHEAATLSEKEAEQPPPLPPRTPSRSPDKSTRSESATSRANNSRSSEASRNGSLTVQNVRKLEKRLSPKPVSPRKGTSVFSSLFSGTSNRSNSTVRRILEPRNPGRLGKRELGPHAFERRMPDEVREQLKYGARPTHVQKIGRDGRLFRESHSPNETTGLIHVLADLCALDEHNESTYLCHPSTRHVRKLYCDGNFCGYWSIQMVLSYVQHMNPRGPQELPNVIEMQDLIEQAWERGICSHSKVETGGLKDTRKWIGTTEALAFFTRIGVKVEALSVGDGREKEEGCAATELLDYVEAYFMSGIDSAQTHRTARITELAPIYFQRLGHSMVIVGLERRFDGSRNLLVFDSSFATSEPVRRLLNGRRAHTSLDSVMKSYRRSDLSLSRWNEFEMLVPLIPPSPKAVNPAAEV